MKKSLITVIMVLVAAAFTGAQAINLEPLSDDLETVFNSFAVGIEDSMILTQVSGDTMGRAALGDKTFYITLAPIGVTFGPGLGNIPDATSTAWRFDIPIPTLLESFIEDQSILDLTKKLMAYPSISMLQFGFRLPADWEFHLRAMVVPTALTAAIIEMADPTLVDAVSAEMINGTLVIRKTLLQDQGFLPAISIGAVYGYNRFGLGFDLAGLGIDPIDFNGQDLAFGGTIDALGTAHTFGFDFNISKRLLFLTPFIKLSPRYQVRTIDVTTALDATLGTSAPIEFSPTIHRETAASSFAMTTGLEIDLWILAINLGLVFDFQQPAINLAGIGELFNGNFTSTELADFELNHVGLTVGFRFQF